MFAETRLRRGVYGQRYDSGQRHDGETTQTLTTRRGKSPRVRRRCGTPRHAADQDSVGRLSSDQLDVLSELAEEYPDRICTSPPVRNIQLHFVHIEGTRTDGRLAAVGIKHAGGLRQRVRNVTGLPYAGVCRRESFDVAPYAHAITYFFSTDDTQNFAESSARISGCKGQSLRADQFHEIGASRAPPGPDAPFSGGSNLRRGWSGRGAAVGAALRGFSRAGSCRWPRRSVACSRVWGKAESREGAS